MLTVYATSWVGITILKGDPYADITTPKHQIFETGVSWGSLALFLTACVSIVAYYAIQRLL